MYVLFNVIKTTFVITWNLVWLILCAILPWPGTGILLCLSIVRVYESWMFKLANSRATILKSFPVLFDQRWLNVSLSLLVRKTLYSGGVSVLSNRETVGYCSRSLIKRFFALLWQFDDRKFYSNATKKMYSIYYAWLLYFFLRNVITNAATF